MKILKRSMVVHEYHRFYFGLDNGGSCPISIKLFFWCGILWFVPHQYHLKNMLGQSWIVPHRYRMNFFVLGQLWILPHQYQTFFFGAGFCGPCPAPSVSPKKHAWKIVDRAPSVSLSYKVFCAWTIVDSAPSVSNFYLCGILWSVPHEYQVK